MDTRPGPLPSWPCQSAPAGRRPRPVARRPTTAASPIWAATAEPLPRFRTPATIQETSHDRPRARPTRCDPERADRHLRGVRLPRPGPLPFVGTDGRLSGHRPAGLLLDRHRVPTGPRVHRDPVTEALPPHRRRVGHGSPHPAGSWRNHHHGYRHQQTLGLRNRRSGPACTPGPASTLSWRHVLSVTGCATVIPPAGGSGSSRGRKDATTDRRGS